MNRLKPTGLLFTCPVPDVSTLNVVWAVKTDWPLSGPFANPSAVEKRYVTVPALVSLIGPNTIIRHRIAEKPSDFKLRVFFVDVIDASG